LRRHACRFVDRDPFGCFTNDVELRLAFDDRDPIGVADLA
jgi:hypothetical protein